MIISRILYFAYYSKYNYKFLLQVVRDVDKAEIGFAVTFIIVQSNYAEELETDILEQG